MKTVAVVLIVVGLALSAYVIYVDAMLGGDPWGGRLIQHAFSRDEREASTYGYRPDPEKRLFLFIYHNRFLAYGLGFAPIAFGGLLFGFSARRTRLGRGA